LLDPAILVLTHAPDRAVAESIAHALLTRRAAACINIGGSVQSMYHWRGQIETGEEIPLAIKTRQSCYLDVEAIIRELHPYEIPEIVAIPFASAYGPYIDWITAETQPG
jgi:periplasmic divalent cation tolerance protein